jgi:hypothetical protein
MSGHGPAGQPPKELELSDAESMNSPLRYGALTIFLISILWQNRIIRHGGARAFMVSLNWRILMVAVISFAVSTAKATCSTSFWDVAVFCRAAPRGGQAGATVRLRSPSLPSALLSDAERSRSVSKAEGSPGPTPLGDPPALPGRQPKFDRSCSSLLRE